MLLCHRTPTDMTDAYECYHNMSVITAFPKLWVGGPAQGRPVCMLGRQRLQTYKL